MILSTRRRTFCATERKANPMSPARPENSQNPGSGRGHARVGETAREFEAFVDPALGEHALGSDGLPSLADFEPRQLLRYAASGSRRSGTLGTEDRSAVETFVMGSSWARTRVVALVRSQRSDAPRLAATIGRRLCEIQDGARAREVVAAAVVEAESEDAKAALKDPKKARTPLARAAAHLGLGQIEDARRALAEGDRKTDDPAVTFLRTAIAAEASPDPLELAEDTRLLRLLDAFPVLLGAAPPRAR